MADQPFVAVWFFVAGRAVEQRLLERLREQGHELTLAQARLAARIGPDGTRLTELAESAQVTKQTAGALVDQLERAGYVERVVDPTDARARLVRIAARGEETVAIARRVEAELEAEWRAHLGDAAYDELETTMARLREVTDPWWSPATVS